MLKNNLWPISYCMCPKPTFLISDLFLENKIVFLGLCIRATAFLHSCCSLWISGKSNRSFTEVKSQMYLLSGIRSLFWCCEDDASSLSLWSVSTVMSFCAHSGTGFTRHIAMWQFAFSCSIISPSWDALSHQTSPALPAGLPTNTCTNAHKVAADLPRELNKSAFHQVQSCPKTAEMGVHPKISNELYVK